jgi:AsmA protein
MRVLKIVGYVAAALVALVALGILGIALFFDPNDYKADIERMVEQNTQRKFTLQGDLKLSVFPWLAVQMGPAQLSERTDTAQFGSQPFIALQSARLSVKLLPLLRGQVQVGKVQLIAPSIRLITDAQGRHNWDDLTGSKTDAADTVATSSGNVSATIAGIEIKNGEVILDDRRDQQHTALHEFSLQATGIGSGQPFTLQMAFTLEQNGATAPVVFSSVVNADWDNKRYALSKVASNVVWKSAGGAKDGLPIELRADTMAVDLAQQTLQLAGLQLKLGQAQITGSLNGTEIVDALKLNGHVELAPVAINDVFKVLNVTPPATRDAQVLKRLSFESDVVATATSLALQKITLQLDDTTARGEFAIADFKALALRFNLDVDRIDFDRYLPPMVAAPASTSNKAAASAPTPIPVAVLRTLNARGKLRVSEARFSGLKLSKLQIELNARDGDVQIAPAQAALYGGSYQGDITLNVAGKQPRLALSAQVTKVDFAPLLKDMLDTQRIAGRGNLNAKLTALGADTQAMLQSLAGTLDFNVADGAYEGMDLWYEIRRARAVLKQQPIPERVGAERTAFSAIQGTGVLHDGVMSNQDLIVAMQYLKVDGKGLVNLVDSTMDYRFNARVLRIPAQESQGGEMQELVDAEIPITAKGPLASPKVRPDIEGYVKARAKEEIKKETDKLKLKLQDKLQDLLRG